MINTASGGVGDIVDVAAVVVFAAGDDDDDTAEAKPGTEEVDWAS